MLTIIEPKQKIGSAWIKELWQFRGLFATLVLRDIKVRYKETFVGILWALLQPAILTFIFTVFFGRFSSASLTTLPYPLFVFSGLIFWHLFSNSVNSATTSLSMNQALIEKIYVPRILIPLSKAGVHAIDFAFGLAVAVGLCFYYGIGNWHAIPAFAFAFLITIILSCGLGCLFSIITIKYRDMRFVIPFLIQITLFVSPIIYPARILASHELLLYLNPLTGALEIARSSLTGGPYHIEGLLISLSSAVVLLAASVAYFKRSERDIADII